MSRVSGGNARGFTLIEAVIAAAVTITTLAGLAQLLLHVARMATDARRAPIVLAAASSKLEQLLALTFTADVAGVPITDQTSDTGHDPPEPSGGTGLSTSPDDSLSRDTPGFVDYLSQDGAPLGPAPAAGAMFARRWRIRASPSAGADALALAVCVVRLTGAAGDPPPEVCLNTARSRR